MKEKLKENKGITLIALVITIIVMLILAAVTINMAVNGGLFGYAGNATSETKTARDEEQDWANVESNLTTEQLIEKYTKNEMITDLIGTTWKMNEEITYGNMMFNIQGTVRNNSINYTYDYIADSSDAGIQIFAWWFYERNLTEGGLIYAPSYELIDEGWYIVYGMDWETANPVATEAPIMTITGGEDTKNPDLINWLGTNAKLIK